MQEARLEKEKSRGKKILIMGLPGAGKSWLSERLAKAWNAAWFNADQVRSMANDWDFTEAGRIRQAQRMKNFAEFETNHGRWAICDFVCPTPETRAMFKPNWIIWVNTIQKGRYEDTNKIFVPLQPQEPCRNRITVTTLMTDKEIEEFARRYRPWIAA